MNNSGWICPRCQNVYAPYIMDCRKCNDYKKEEFPKMLPGTSIIQEEPIEKLNFCFTCQKYMMPKHLCTPPHILAVQG